MARQRNIQILSSSPNRCNKHSLSSPCRKGSHNNFNNLSRRRNTPDSSSSCNNPSPNSSSSPRCTGSLLNQRNAR